MLKFPKRVVGRGIETCASPEGTARSQGGRTIGERSITRVMLGKRGPPRRLVPQEISDVS